MQNTKYIRDVLILMDDFLPKEESMGGLAEHIRHLISGFDDSYFFYIAGKSGGDTEYYVGENYVYFVPDETDFIINNTIPNDNDVMKQLILDQTSKIQFIIKFLSGYDVEPELIHICDWSTGIAGVELANYYNVPILSAFHLSMSAHSKPYIFGREITREEFVDKYDLFSMAFTIEDVMMQKSNIVTVVSEDYKKKLSHKIKNDCVVIHNGINIDDFKVKTTSERGGTHDVWGRYDDRPIKMLYIGRFSDQKGVGELFSTNIPSDVEIIMAGDDENGGEDHLYDMVHFLDESVDGWTYVGKVSGESKVDLFDYVDAIIMPSKHEPFGIVALEALASKTPLLCSGVNGLNNFLTKDSYISCSASSYYILKAIEKFKNMTSEEKRNMVVNGMIIAKKHTWKSCRNKYLELYNKLI